MPTTTRSRTQKSRTRTELEEHAAELDALGLGIAPGLPGDDRSEFVERAKIGAGQPRRGALAADPPAVSPELVDEAVDRAAGRRRVRQALGVPSERRISNEVIDELLAGASTEEEIAGPGGLLAELTKRLVERARREAEEQARREAEEQARREAEEQARPEAEERDGARPRAADGVASKAPRSEPAGSRGEAGVAPHTSVVGAWIRQHRLISGVLSIAVIAAATVAIILASTSSKPRTPPPTNSNAANTSPPPTNSNAPNTSPPATSSTASSSNAGSPAQRAVLTKYVPAGASDCSNDRLSIYDNPEIICFTASGAYYVLYDLWSSSFEAHAGYDNRLSGTPACSAATQAILHSYKGGGATCDIEDTSGVKRASIYWADDKNKITGELVGNDANDHALARTWRSQYVK